MQTDGLLRRTWTDRRVRRTGRVLAILLVGTLGAGLGLVLGGTTETDAGPFVVDLSLRPHGHGETVVAIPPLGELRLDTHVGPVALDVQVVEIREEAARQLVDDPEQLAGVGREVEGDLGHALVLLALRALVVTLVGSLLLGWLVFRTPRRTFLTGGAGLVALVGSSVLALATFNSRALSEPRYTGLLASAPAAVGDVEDVVNRVDAYSAALGKIVGNMSALYATASGLPTFTPQDDTIRVLSVSDLHLSPSAYDVIRPVITQFSIDVVVDSGDSTDYGTAAESSYVSAIGGLGVPYVWVRGNHDSYVTQAAVSAQPGAVVLDGPEPRQVAGLTFVGRGDPRFTPDKRTGDDEVDTALLEGEGDRLREDAEASQADVAVVHEPASAGRAVGAARLVLAGHTHKRSAQERDGTLLLVQGSTGGAGLRSLESAEPTPVAMSVLYLDPTTHEVLARDDITLGGLGLTSAQIERSVTGPEARRPAGAE
ncbi:MAG: metallophosphoesterase [Frankiales bacterium]|nr:metallophosphoesterase [Frankiales bacterium]